MKLFPFQEKAVEFLLSNQRAVLGSEMGTGKSAIASAAADIKCINSKDENFNKIFIVCPATVKNVWANEIIKFTSLSRHSCKSCAIQVINSSKDEIKSPYVNWVIFSYELARKRFKDLKTYPLVLILDEVQKCKSITAQVSKTLLTLKTSYARNVPYVWCLTGTPFPNNIADAYTYFNFCLRGKLGSYWEFAEKYSYVRNTTWGKAASGLRKNKLPELVELVRPILHRDEIKDVIQELPEFLETIVPLEETKRSREINELVVEEREELMASLADGSGFKKGSKLSTLRREWGEEKIEQAVEFIKDLLEQDLKVVVFAHHKITIAALALSFQSAGIITGETRTQDRTFNVKSFQKGGLNCLVLSLQAGGVGITLTASHTVVFVEEDWTPGVMEQAQARVMRIGQKNFCNYYYLHLPGELDSMIHNAWKSKKKNVDSFWKEFKGEKEEVTEEEQIVWE